MNNQELVWRHLVKRMYDECGTTKAEEFIRRVEAGEHDVISPWSSKWQDRAVIPEECGYCGGTGEVACSSTNYMSCPRCSKGAYL